MSTVDKSQYFDEQSDYDDKVVEKPPKKKVKSEKPPKKKVKRSPDSSMFDQLFHGTQKKFKLKFLESETEDDEDEA